MTTNKKGSIKKITRKPTFTHLADNPVCNHKGKHWYQSHQVMNEY